VSPSRAPLKAAVVAVLLALVVTFVDLGPTFDLTRFLRVGEVASARGFVEADLADVDLVPGWGHDGQANYVLARVFPDLGAAEGVVDSVTYRARRIVYPALASLAPPGMPLVVTLWVLNLAAVAGAAAAVAATARRHGASWLAGASVGLTPAFIGSVVVDLGDGLALALAAAGVVVWRRDRSTALAVTMFTLAALTRETTLVVPAAVFLLEGRGRRPALLVPPLILGGWIVILGAWIGDPGKSAAQFRPPFLGWVDQGLATGEIAVAFTFLVGSVWVAWKLWDHDRTWAVVLLLDAAVLVLVDRGVLFDPLNLSRVVPWMVPFAIIAATMPTTRGTQPTKRHSVVKVTP
jgi:hypothetical protein